MRACLFGRVGAPGAGLAFLIGLLLLLGTLGAAPARAESGPRLAVEPASAGPGETVRLRGEGWPANSQVSPRFREADATAGFGMFLAGTTTDSSGAFSTDLTIPPSIFGSATRAIISVVPGDYAIDVVSTETKATVPFMVVAPRAYPLLWGEVFLDLDHNGVRSAADVPAPANIDIRSAVPDSPLLRAMTDGRGRYMITPMIGAGRYDLTTRVERDGLIWTGTTNVWLAVGQATRADLLLHAEPMRPERCFAETGYCVAHDELWSYFSARGGARVLGYPVSRTFSFEGKATQFFQRVVLQRDPVAGVQRLNLLDPGLMPYSQINGATFPTYDPSVASAAPDPATPDYGREVLRHLRAWVPDEWNGQPVGFLSSYLSAGQANPGDFPALVSLEIWGFPTSRPMRDPNNNEFVYQRFQRGILHYQGRDAAGRPITGGILLADWFKSLITGVGLPTDLERQAAADGSRYLRQHCPDKPNAVCRPGELPMTDFTRAFEREF